jgi:hypothetical protein
VLGGQPDVLVEGEAAGPSEGDQPGIAAGSQLVVDRQRRRSGGQAEHRSRLSPQQRGDRIGSKTPDGLGVLQDDDFHRATWSP